MTPIYNNPFRENAAHYKKIGWSFVVGTVLLLLAGFFAYAADPTTPIHPTVVRELAADTAVVDTLLVGMPASRR